MTKPKIPKKLPEERPERIGPPMPIIPEKRERPEKPVYEPKPEKIPTYEFYTIN